MKKKIVLLALIFVVLAIPAAYWQLQDGIMLDGTFFAKKNDGLFAHGDSYISIALNENGAAIELLLDGDQLSAVLMVQDDLYMFDYEDGRSVQGYAGRWMGELVDEEGTPLWMKDNPVIVVSDEPEPSILTREYSLSNTLYHLLEGQFEQRGHIVAILVSAVIYALGVASFFWPEEVYFFGRCWRYANPELSYDGIVAQKIGGAACAIVGAALLYMPLIL